MERCSGRGAPIQCGMHLFDAHQQRLGTVVLARDDYFVMRQELGICQLVAVPMVAVAGVVGSLVFLTLTPGEIELYCRPLERKERDTQDRQLHARLVPAQPLAKQP